MLIYSDVWVIIRFFEKKQINFLERFNKVNKLIKVLVKLDIKNIQILISKDMDNVGSFDIIKNEIYNNPFYKNINIKIYEVIWNCFTDLLNYWIMNNVHSNIKYSFIVSSEIWYLINSKILEVLLLPFKNEQYCVSWIFINHDFDRQNKKIKTLQLISNTCCIWETNLLYQVWMFWKEWEDGVEEVWPLVKLINLGYKIKISQLDLFYYIYSNDSQSYQRYKFQSKRIRQINSYIKYLKLNFKISKTTFNKIYCFKKNNIFAKPISINLRKKYTNVFFDLIKKWTLIE